MNDADPTPDPSLPAAEVEPPEDSSSGFSSALVRPLSAFALRAPEVPRPEALECVLRSVLLPPLILVGFGLGSNLLHRSPVGEFFLFAGLVGFMATPVGFVERWLYRSSLAAKAAAAVWLPLALGGVAFFLIAQTVFAMKVFKGGAQELALQAAFEVIKEVPKREAFVFLFPLGFPFTIAALLRWARVRWRWHPLFLALTSLPLGWLLLLTVESGRRSRREAWTFGLIVLVSSIFLPAASALAAAITRRWRARQSD